MAAASIPQPHHPPPPIEAYTPHQDQLRIMVTLEIESRMAQIVMREDPERVRSAILDSVVPVDTQMLHIEPNFKATL